MKKGRWGLALCVFSTGILGLIANILGGFVFSFLFYVSGFITLWEIFVFYRCVSGISVHRELSSTTLMAGEKLEVSIHVSKRGRLIFGWQTIQERLMQSSKPNKNKYTLQKNFYLNESKIEYKVTDLKRGRYRFAPLLIGGGDFLGIVERQKEMGQEQMVKVYPKVVPLPRWSPSEAERRSESITKERRVGSTPNIIRGLRHYRYGDRLQQIDWKASARGQGLKVKEFEEEISQNALILLDQSEGSYRELDDQIFERAVSLTVSLTYQLIRQSYKTSVLLIGKNTILQEKMTTDVQIHRFLDVLIDIQPDGRKNPSTFGSLQEWNRLEQQKVLLITPRADQQTLSLIRELKQRNYSVEWFWIAHSQAHLSDSVKEEMSQLQVQFWNIDQDHFELILQKGDSIAYKRPAT